MLSATSSHSCHVQVQRTHYPLFFLSICINDSPTLINMGRNGMFGSFQGFDAFGKASTSQSQPSIFALTAIHRRWRMSRSRHVQVLSVGLRSVNLWKQCADRGLYSDLHLAVNHSYICHARVHRLQTGTPGTKYHRG